MKKLIINIEKANDGTYSAYAENVEGVYGMGDTPEEAKKEAMKGLELFLEYNDAANIPPILKGDYKVIYKFDTVSLLNYFKSVFTAPALERITGINQKQIHHYTTGLKKPRAAQAEKIEKGLHKLAEELLAAQL